MKQIWIVLLSGSVYALPLGNPVIPMLLSEGVIQGGHYAKDPSVSLWDAWSLRFGFYGDYVWNRHIHHSNDSATHAGLASYSLWVNGGECVLNLYDRLDLFAILGTCKMNVYSAGTAFAPSIQSPLRYTTDSGSLYSLGMRSVLWERDCLFIGGALQYLSTQPHVRYLDTTVAGTQEKCYSLTHKELSLKYHEWQLGVSIAYRLDNWVPYTGITWSKGSGHFKDHYVMAIPDCQFNRVETDKLWSYAFGVSMMRCDMMEITGEIRFAGEIAASISSTLRW